MSRWSKTFLFFILLSGFFVFPVLAKEVDTDSDGLSDVLEEKLGTNPAVADTDGDGYEDKKEVFYGYNPLAGKANEKVKRSVEVNLSKQQLTYFFNGVKIGTEPVSTGIIGADTPVGNYNIIRKLPSHLYTGTNYYYPNTKWNLEFKRSYYLHTAYWHNQFGIKPMSHGCVNMSEKGAKKLYDFLRVGDSVKVYGTTPKKSLAVKK